MSGGKLVKHADAEAGSEAMRLGLVGATGRGGSVQEPTLLRGQRRSELDIMSFGEKTAHTQERNKQRKSGEPGSSLFILLSNPPHPTPHHVVHLNSLNTTTI